MKSKVKIILLATSCLLVIASASIGYYFINKGPVDIRNSAAIKITSNEFYDQFSIDSTLALKKFSGKVVEILGEVNTISVNLQKEKIILLNTHTGGAFINCTMDEDPGNIKPGAQVIIKGLCSGIGQGDEDLGIKADVYLTRCFLIKLL